MATLKMIAIFSTYSNLTCTRLLQKGKRPFIRDFARIIAYTYTILEKKFNARVRMSERRGSLSWLIKKVALKSKGPDPRRSAFQSERLSHSWTARFTLSKYS